MNLRFHVLFVLIYMMLSIIMSSRSSGGEEGPGIPPDTDGLPIELTSKEREFLALIGASSTITDPPLGPVRSCAEWDESIGVFTLWANAELIDELQEDNDVYILTEDETWWLNWLASNSIPTDNIHFLIAPTNSLYTRDYGPWFIWDANNDFGLVDNIYNRPRPDDDVIPEKIAQEYGVPYYGMDLVHTGGNYYTDGLGNALSTRLVYKENPGKTQAEVLQIMSDYLGISNYMTPEIDVSIEHIDTFGKILAPDRMIWGEFPEFSTPWFYCEAAYKTLKTLESPYGWPYKIERMPLWDYGGSWTAYINALQTNRKIITGKYYTGNDHTAKAIYETAAPGYEVVNVHAGGTTWGDSIHCRTRNFHKGDMIRVYPRPHWEATDDDSIGYEVTTEVITAPDTTLNENPVIKWTTTGGAPFSEAPMYPTVNPDEFRGMIPAQPHGTLVSYYIHARDMEGRTKDYPLVAPQGMFTIEVDDDVTPPELDHDTIHGLTLDDWPFMVEAAAMDNTGIPDLYIEFSIDGDPQPVIPMSRQPGRFVFKGRLDGDVSLGSHVDYRIVALDSASPSNMSTQPPVGWNRFFIEPQNNIVVIELDDSPVSGEVLVDICDDFGMNVHYTTSWPSDLSLYDRALICLGMWPMAKSISYGQANELVSFLSSGGSAYLEGGNAWAQDPQCDFYRAYFGIASASSGASIEAPILGMPASFCEGMQFGYLGENVSSDHLTAVSGSAQGLLECNEQVKAVAFDSGTYKTVAASFQIADLVEDTAPDHIKFLVAHYLRHMGLDIDLIVHSVVYGNRSLALDLFGEADSNYLLFYALGPGYHPLGDAGIVKLDPATLGFLFAGAIPANGQLHVDMILPNDPALSGVEIFLQSCLKESTSGQRYLTNRDRITLNTD